MARKLSQNTINKFKKKLLAEKEQLVAIRTTPSGEGKYTTF